MLTVSSDKAAVPIHILIVDDDPGGLLALSEAVQVRLAHGVVVDTAPDTAAALRYLAVKRYDIALCDVRMPGRDGIALLQEIAEKWPSIRVIMVTGGEGKEEQALFSGAYAFLHKPIDVDHLISVVEAAVRSNSPAPQPGGVNRRTMRLLIVDDDHAAASALREAVQLRLPAVETSTADSGSSALLLLAAHEYDAVLADACMPGLDGFALLKEVRLLRPDAPVVLCSESQEPDIERRAKQAGAYAFLAKSSDREEFIATVNQALQRGQLARRVHEQNQQDFLSAFKDTAFAATGLGAMLHVRELSETLQDKLTELTKRDPPAEDPPADMPPTDP